MDGLPEFRQAVQALVFGADHPALHEGRITTVQTPGGSGALKVGADFIKRWWPDAEIWVSDPTWDNHTALFEGAGLREEHAVYLVASGRLCVSGLSTHNVQHVARSIISVLESTP